MLRTSLCSLTVLCLLGVLAGSRLYAQHQVPNPELVTCSGVITKIEEADIPFATVSFTMNVQGDSVRVETAPGKFLTKLGLSFAEQQQVSVTGLVQTIVYTGVKPAPAAPAASYLLACTVSVKGKTYLLRDDKGVPVWNYLDLYYEPRDVSGEITAVQSYLPNRAGHPSLNLTVSSAGKTYEVYDVAPQYYTAKVKFAPAVGMKITMTGWASVQKEHVALGTEVEPGAPSKHFQYLLRTITVNGTTYVFRDAHGKGVWEIEKPAVVCAPPVGKITL